MIPQRSGDFLLTPQTARLKYYEAAVKLLTGQLEEGFRDYEGRWDHEHFVPHRREYSVPQWTGQPLEGKTILVWHEQGFGDTIMMHRYVRMLEGMAATVHLELPPPLVALFEANTQQRHEPGQAAEVFDYHCPMMSLPYAFKTALATVPPPARLVPPIRGAWRPNREGPNVGLTWFGDPNNSVNDERSVPFAELSPIIAQDAGIWPLQYAFRESEVEAIRRSRLPIVQYRDFGALAAVIEEMDLVITVDTATAHLAGAMGRPVWVMVPHDPHWMYLTERTDCPWYPTMRLFRQRTLGSWTETVERVSAALRVWRLSCYRPKIVATAG